MGKASLHLDSDCARRRSVVRRSARARAQIWCRSRSRWSARIRCRDGWSAWTCKEHLSAPVPMDLGFEDENGKPVTLKDYFDGSVPVILTMNYSNCPMLCSLQLTALVEGLKKVDWTIGKEYRIVTVSYDPTETAGARAPHQGALPRSVRATGFRRRLALLARLREQREGDGQEPSASPTTTTKRAKSTCTRRRSS